MKCECKECYGTGKVTCEECNGDGSIKVTIENLMLRKGMKNEDELRELKNDFHRVTRQAEALTKLQPERASSYQAQLKACLSVIEAEAEKLMK